MKETLHRAGDAPAARAAGAGGRAARTGLLLGGVAILFWSFASSLIFFGARETDPWVFLALSSLVGGAVQLGGWWWHHGELRSALVLPWRLWAVSVACFVLYGVAWPLALATSSRDQVVGVSLINYLWPVLTVVFGSWWVPGTRLTLRAAGATGVAVVGIVCANGEDLARLIAGGRSPEVTPIRRYLPYLLAGAGAVMWAVYSASLARWRAWAGNYATSPLGFLVTGAVAVLVLVGRGSGVTAPGVVAAWLILAYGVGPLAIGYLLWEVALSKAPVQALGVMAAATPVLSTLWLCVFLGRLPGPELIVAAALVGVGVLLSVRR